MIFPELRDELDDLKRIVHIIRHDCDHITEAVVAVDLIHAKTDIPVDRIITLIKRYFK